MKNRRNRHNRQKIIELPEVSSKSLIDMGDLVFESIDGQTNDIKELRIPAHLFFKMLETMRADKDNREFIQELKEYTMLMLTLLMPPRWLMLADKGSIISLKL